VVAARWRSSGDGRAPKILPAVKIHPDNAEEAPMKTSSYLREFWVITACLLLILPVSVQAQMTGPPVPFSAELTIYSDDDDDFDDDDDDDDDAVSSEWITGGYLKGRYFASLDGVRLEFPIDGQPFVGIYNFPRMALWYYFESESTREYIEEAIEADDFHDIGLGWVGRPCPANAGTRATRGGIETLDGRKTEIWTCASRESGTVKVWYDPRLQAILRTEDEFGYGELTNIREGRQPDSLFDLPEGYSKVDATEFDMTPEFGRRSPFSSQ
jgi:hypothetical protein